MNPKIYKMIYCSFIGLTFLNLCSCVNSKIELTKFKESQTIETEKVIYRFESQNIDTTARFIRNDSTIIVFYFFDGFNDTIRVLYDTTNFKVGGVFEDSSNVSTEYSGIHFGVKVNPTKNEIQLDLLRQKKSVVLILYKKYPICTLHRENGVWIANYRVNKLVLN